MTNSHRLFAILACAAIQGCGPGPEPLLPLPATPEATVQAFLQAARTDSVDRMAAYWGDEDGPANVSGKIPADQRQQRLQILQRVLRSDSAFVTAIEGRGSGARTVTMRVHQGARRFTVPFTVVRYRDGWLVKEMNLDNAMPSAGERR